jgi:choline-sulfatase
VGATAAAVAIAIYDYSALREMSVPVAEAVRVSAAATSFLAFIATAIVVAVVRWITPSLEELWAGFSDAPARVGAQLVFAPAAVIAVGLIAFVGLGFSQDEFVSPLVHRLAVTLLVGTTAIAIAVGRTPLSRLLERALARIEYVRVGSLVALTLLIAGGVASLLVAAWPVLTQLDVRPALSALAIVAAAFVTCLLSAYGVSPPKAPLWRRGVMLLSTCGFVFITWTAVVPISRALRFSLELKPTLSTFIIREINEGGKRLPKPAKPSLDRTAVCSPGATPPSASDVGTAAVTAPDIIVVVVDAVRWDHTSLSGYQRDTTPELKRHAATGAVFERAYSPASSTRQTTKAMHTGVHASLVYYVENMRQKWGVAYTDAQVTWAEYFNSAGYETVALSCSPRLFSKNSRALKGFSVVDETPYDSRKTNGHSIDLTVDLIIERLSAPRERGPRFIWTHTHEPHQPYEGGPNPVSYGPDEQDRYDASIHFVDAELGRLLDFVQAPERAANTWLMITADHGQAFGEHSSRLHGKTVYEEQIHVPLLIWGPGVVAGRIGVPVSLIDLLPTAMDVAGLAIPPALCGRSLSGALAGGTLDPRPVYAENVPDRTRAYFSVAMIEGHLKTVVKPKTSLTELYALDSDPTELKDLAGERGELLQTQLAKMRELQMARGLNPDAYGL